MRVKSMLKLLYQFLHRKHIVKLKIFDDTALKVIHNIVALAAN